MTTPWHRCLEALRDSWAGLLAGGQGGEVSGGEGWFAAQSPNPVLNNAVLLRPDRLDTVVSTYGPATDFAVWARLGDGALRSALIGAGFAPSTTTRPMLLELRELAPVPVEPTVERDAPPEVLASLNGVDAALLRDVPGLTPYATADRTSGLALQQVRGGVVVSFVATAPAARRRGAASAVLRAALSDARTEGAQAAFLQATSVAERLYARYGFQPVGRWQEWTPPR